MTPMTTRTPNPLWIRTRETRNDVWVLFPDRAKPFGSATTVVFECLTPSPKHRRHCEHEEDGCDTKVAAEDHAEGHDPDLEPLSDTKRVEASIFSSSHQQFNRTARKPGVNHECHTGSDRGRTEHDEEHPHDERLGIVDQAKPHVDGDTGEEQVEESADLWATSECGGHEEQEASEDPTGLAVANAETIAQRAEHDVICRYSEAAMDE